MSQIGQDTSDATRVVLQFIEGATAAQSVDEACRIAIGCVERSVGTDGVSVQLAGEDRSIVSPEFVADCGVEVEFSPPSSPLDGVPEPILISNIEAAADSGDIGEAVDDRRINALGVFPLQYDGIHLGTLRLFYLNDHPFADDEVLVVRSIAGHLSAVIAQLQAMREIELCRRTETGLRENQTRTMQLQQLTATLSKRPDTDAIYEELVGYSMRAVSARGGGLLVATDDGNYLDFVCARGFSKETVDRFEKLPLEASLPATDSYREKSPVLLDSQADFDAEYPEADNEDWGDAVACIPVATTGICHGVLVLSFARPRTFGAEERAYLQSLAGQGALALERAHFYDETKRTLRRRSELIGMIAHDLRSPLSVISMLASSVAGDNQRSSKMVRRNVQKMQRLVQDMLDLSAIDSGTLQLSPKRWELADILASIVESAHIDSEGPTLELVGDEDDDGVEVVCDRDRLEQILTNLIENAVKFTDETGSIRIRRTQKDDEVVVSVEDTGRGIDPDELSDVFNRFWSGGRRQTEERSGHGLGLFIVKNLVKAHGGKVWAESTPGEGSAFFFTLPRPGAEPERMTRAGCDVLLVDDNEAFCREIDEVLTRQGYDVEVALNGRKAMQWLEENESPAVVLLDLMMPVMSGWDLYRQMQNDPGLAGIPVVVISSADRDRVESLESKAAGYLPKPVGLKEISDAVKPYCAG